jgi:alkylhydroperoxidase family enzyme
MSEDDVAALDGDWAANTPQERAAFAFARKISFEPHRIADTDIAELKKQFTELQILEMVLSVAQNNSTNRWKEGAGIPQSKSSSNFAKNADQPLPKDRVLPLETYLTPTAEKYLKSVTRVTPLQVDPQTGKPTTETIATRPKLESRESVEQELANCAKRTPRLPLVPEATARDTFADVAPKTAMTPFARLLAHFPGSGKARLQTQISAVEKGDLSPLLKAQISWIVARQDRAWYATADAKSRLKSLGQSEDQIYSLDGDGTSFLPRDRALFAVARQLAASPIVLTDAEAAEAVRQTDTRSVVQLINYVTVQTSFNRITEAAGLPHTGAENR